MDHGAINKAKECKLDSSASSLSPVEVGCGNVNELAACIKGV